MPTTAVPRGPRCSSLAWRVRQADKAAPFWAESVGKQNDWPLFLSVRHLSRAGLPVSILTCHACYTDKQTVLLAHALTAGQRRGIARLHLPASSIAEQASGASVCARPAQEGHLAADEMREAI